MRKSGVQGRGTPGLESTVTLGNVTLQCAGTASVNLGSSLAALGPPAKVDAVRGEARRCDE